MKDIFLKYLLVLTLALGLVGALTEDPSRNDNADPIAYTDMIIGRSSDVGQASGIGSSDAVDPLLAERGLMPRRRRPKCTSKNCDMTSSYCAGRKCLPMGSCRRKSDCFNPDNQYVTDACVGDILCSEDKQCVKECTVEAGGTCDSSMDCSPTQYCQRGVCVDMGQCLSDVDCFNPDNQYPVIMCVGLLSCSSDNQCGVTCGDSCPAEQPQVECLVSPCSVLSCSDEVESCVDQYCGGCNALAFDKAGNQVCQTGQ